MSDVHQEVFAEWISCPECGSSDAYITFWWGDRDLDVECPECGESEFFS